MEQPESEMARQIAQAAVAFEQQRTGHRPTWVAVVVSDDTLVITLHGALSPAEMAVAQSPAGAAHLQEFQRQLFDSNFATLRQEIRRITGMDVREAGAEVESKHGTVIRAFTTGTIVQVFSLAGSLPSQVWNDRPSPGPQ